jgi:chromosome segregation ATPase
MASEAILIPKLNVLDDIVDTAEDLLTFLAKFYQKFKDEGQLNQFKEFLKENRELLTLIKKKHCEIKEMDQIGSAAQIKLDVNQLVKNLQQDLRFKKYLEYKHAIKLRNYSIGAQSQEIRKEFVPIAEQEAKESLEDARKFQAEINYLKNEHNKALTTLDKKQNEINQINIQKSNIQNDLESLKEEINFLKTQNSKYEKILFEKNEEMAELKSQNQEYAEQIAAFGKSKLEMVGESEASFDEEQMNKDLTE